MSLYVQWTNRIKADATGDWLTTSQRSVYTRLLHSGVDEPFVSLYGPSGSGKSFIARLLESEQGYVHVTRLDQVPTGTTLVVVDGEEYSRLMRPLAMIRKLKRVVVLSHRPPSDPMPKVELTLTDRDIRQFQSNLTVRSGIMDSFLISHQGVDLGKILRDEAVKRGQSDAAE